MSAILHMLIGRRLVAWMQRRADHSRPLQPKYQPTFKQRRL